MAIPPPIARLLKTQGACTSGEAIAALRAADGLSGNAARKRLQRTGKDLSRLNGIGLPNNARILYSPSDYRSPRFFEGVGTALTASGSVYGKTLNAVSSRGGLVTHQVFEALTGSPARRRGHISPEQILKRLAQHGIVTEIQSSHMGRLISVNPAICPTGVSEAHLRGRMMAERLCLLGLREWARKTGLCSYGRVSIRGDDESPEFGTTRWDLVGPSYVSPFIGFVRQQVKPGFIVADVCLGSTLSPLAIEYFHHKVALLRNSRSRPFLAVLVGDFDLEAFHSRGRSHCLLVSPDTLFGKDVVDALIALIRTVEHAGAVAAKSPGELDRLLESLGRIEGAKSALRGFAFELFCAHLVCKALRSSVDVGLVVQDPHSGESAEIDVQAIIGEEEVKCIECKAFEIRKPVPRSEVADWLTRQVPRIHAHLQGQSRFQSHRKSFEIWSVSGFDDDALSLLKESSAKCKRYKIGWKSADEITGFAKTHKLHKLAKTFWEKWMKDPVFGSDL